MIEKNIKKLIKILEESKIDQLEVSSFWGKDKIKISKNTDYLNKNSKLESNVLLEENSDKIELDLKNEVPVKEVAENLSPLNEVNDDSNNIKINSPLVGTFYKSSKPGDPPFINVGDKINKGDIICIIEAMKIFNEIEAESSGKVIKILIEDGTPVEYDQPLVIISSLN